MTIEMTQEEIDLGLTPQQALERRFDKEDETEPGTMSPEYVKTKEER